MSNLISTTKEPFQRFQEHIGQSNFQNLLQRLEQLNQHILTRGILPYKNAARHSDLFTGYTYGEFYDWDLYFDNIYLSYYGISQFCRSNVEAFLDNQLHNGFVARTLIEPRMRQHFKPFLAQIALMGAQQTANFAWLEGNYYERLKKYLDYWFWFSDFDKNGLCVWDSADHSGMDNQSSRAGIHDSMAIEGVDLNCYLLRELEAMSLIAQKLNLEQDANKFQLHQQTLKKLINEVFWNEDDGFYYDRNERTGQQVKVKSVAGFIPLWLGIVPPERAERLVQEHLLNPEEFWLKYPVATYAKTEPDYYQQRSEDECNWRGTCWIPTNYMVFQGLRKQGFNEAAKELAYKSFFMVLSEETTREYYNAETGCGQGLNPFWGWSSLAYFMPLEFELGYDSSQLHNGTLIDLATKNLDLKLSF